MKLFKSFRFSPVVTGLALALAFTCFYLGSWQFRRFEEKKVFFEALAEATPDTLPALEAGRDDWAATLGQRFAITGTFDYDREMLLLNRTKNKRPGVKLITPLKLAGAERYILVDRGFIIKEESDSETRKMYHKPVGETTIMGASYQTREGTFFSPPDHILDDPAAGWFRMNIAKMKKLLPYGDQVVGPVYFEQLRAGANDTYPMSMASDVLPPFRHLNYTMQWISFGIFALIMGLFVQFRQKSGPPVFKPRTAEDSAGP